MNALKSVFKVGCGMFVLAAILFAALMYYGKSSGEKIVKDFFAAAKSDSPEQFRERIHIGLREKAEPELMQAFLQGVVAECGEFQGLNTNGMSFSDKLENDIRFQEFKGTFRFEKKEIPMELGFANGKLLSLSVEDKTVAEKAMEATRVMPKTLEGTYAKKAEAFWQAAMGGETEKAFDMLHDVLQRQYGRDKFLEVFRSMTEKAGKVERIKFLSSRPKDDDSGKVLFFYTLDFPEQKDVAAHSVVQFVGFSGHLMGFDIPSTEKP